MIFLIPLNDSTSSDPHFQRACFRVRVINGAVVLVKSRKKRRYQVVNPRNYLFNGLGQWSLRDGSDLFKIGSKPFPVDKMPQIF